MRDAIPLTSDGLKHVFAFMINEGVILSFSLLLNRIRSDSIINSPKDIMICSLTTKVLWILEDFAGGDKEEVRAILDNGIVARVF
jgi:hypothetical protein